ncbi:UDP-glucose 4-epimerase GalE [Pseudomaricurvus alkylphenolicus]|jgi:UDP-glucose 4-epimerase|uniref:UDP-glucose 4-epimerase GalE n=1 Tax=Pseudomaricurvus alkylphenolicus TaxID=1306991 RepID=UPI001424880A|nr:UDP-glucose 4-epimerase GalE [Pseudomaricurvus alkylphenolicus]NIB44267.1 UDP-glucose 4-epimerase GalE [Pseudomaricurvus alkylphenolicus]
MKVLVTGGAGYIGSHTCIELMSAGFEPVVVDNFCNSKPMVMDRLSQILGRELALETADVTDRDALREIFARHQVGAVLHFAGLKAVGESVQKPLTYYHNNISATLTLCQVMAEYDVHDLIFSSSATVYGDPATVPIDESFPTSATNPYGRSKLMVEEILRDLCRTPDNPWRVSLLRYFNPVGAHASGLIGEDPKGIPNNLLPYVSQVAVGRLPHLNVFGQDYDTPDGTGVRDYIHVLDLAQGHVKALQFLLDNHSGCYTHNLGTGRGYSVLEIVAAFAAASDREVPYEIQPRRPGDVAQCYANPEKAQRELGWQAQLGIERMMEDTWRWQSNNPEGYQ